LNGEPENEFEGAGDTPAPEEPSAELPSNLPEDHAEAGGGSEFRRKPFTAWGAARVEDTGPSLLHRASQRLKKLFSRKERPADIEVAEEAAPAEMEFEPVAEPEAAPEFGAAPEFEPIASSDEIVSETPAEPEAKEDLKFLWSRSEPDAPVSEPVAEESYSSTDEFAAPASDESDEPVLETRSLLDDEPEPPKKPGFFRRLFSPRSKPAIPEPELVREEEVAEPSVEAEAPAEAPAADVWHSESTQPFDVSFVAGTQPMDVSGLDDALPMDDSKPAAESAESDFAATMDGSMEAIPAPVAKKPGFFARLMGRRAEEKEPEPEAVDEFAEDVVADSETDQLDAAHDVFAAAKDEFVPEQTQADSFASVDDALPLEEPVAETRAEPLPELDQSLHSMPIYDFDSPKADDRSTMEVDSTDLDDARPTAEVSASDVSEITAHADEEERDTDEFEQIDFEATIAEDPDKTGEVKREPGFFKKLFSKTKEVTQVEPAVAPPPTANPNFLVQKFRTFYNEIVVYKNQKAEFTAGFATAILTDYTADLSPEQAAQSLIVRLQQMLELQLAESSWMGGEAQELYPEAQYAMAVLADEMLTNMEWPGQAAWGQHRLELAVFKTAASDLEFFKRVDRLLKNGPQTTGTRDLARVYLLVVASGFKGKYRPFDLFRPLAEYRRRLYEFVYGGDALLLYADDRRIFPEATSVTVAGKGVRRFSMAQQWAAILVLLLVGYTVISHITWNRVSADLKDIAARVEQARTATTAVDSPNGGGGR
jgi:type IV/VI secretion system ImpK/VasF family protein